MEISAEKTKMMTNNTNGINTDIKVQGQSLNTVHSFKYLGAIVSDNGSRQEVLSRIAQTTAALTRLNEAHLERQDHQSTFQGKTAALPCHLHLPIRLRNMDPHSRSPTKNTKHGDEVLQKTSGHFLYPTHHQRRSPTDHHTSHWTTP